MGTHGILNFRLRPQLNQPMADRKAVFNGVKLMIEKLQKRISFTSNICQF